MVNLIKTIYKRFKINLNLIEFEGAGLTIILCIICLLLASNIYRDILKGKQNYDIYTYEKQTLEEVKERNKELTEEYNVTNSDEAIVLQGKDSYGYAKPHEELYRTKNDPYFFTEKKVFLEVDSRENYSKWWKGLIK
jgi:hypothetical protein